jgi:hypothetical protein
MTLKLKLTRIQHLNDTIVIQQEGGHYFIAARDSFVIDKDGLINLLWELIKIGYIEEKDTELLEDLCRGWNKEKEYAKNQENNSNINIR